MRGPKSGAGLACESVCKCVCDSNSALGQVPSTWDTDLGDDEFEGGFKFLHVCSQSAHQLPCLLSIEELDVLAGGSRRWREGGRHALRTRPRPRHAPRPQGPAPYRSRLQKSALRRSTAMRSPMRDSSTRYPKVSRPCKTGPALRGAQGSSRGGRLPSPPSCGTWRP